MCSILSNALSFFHSGVRPFGVSLLIAGWDSGRPYLFQCDPSGAYFAWKATAMGKNHVSGKAFLEKRYLLFRFFILLFNLFKFNYLH
ncbi:Proteasome subunit alpha type-2 [Araneus ventricosus]|uniref:Proteasome subunit alpha type-2 n=1 Tax=Araneus ventricosus TaxID=182803 RepID=A0A4Y2VEX7_ARAVE|nr:Proteasome subunit alpha type-2 [Araneus ventricosus]